MPPSLTDMLIAQVALQRATYGNDPGGLEGADYHFFAANLG